MRQFSRPRQFNDRVDSVRAPSTGSGRKTDSNDYGQIDSTGQRSNLFLDAERYVVKTRWGPAPSQVVKKAMMIARQPKPQLGSIPQSKPNQAFRQIHHALAVVACPGEAALDDQAARRYHDTGFGDIGTVRNNFLFFCTLRETNRTE